MTVRSVCHTNNDNTLEATLVPFGTAKIHYRGCAFSVKVSVGSVFLPILQCSGYSPPNSVAPTQQFLLWLGEPLQASGIKK